MKNFIIALITILASSAFAQNHMIRMYGWDAGSRATSFDLSMSNDNQEIETKRSRVALNYAFSVNSYIQLGLNYALDQKTTDGNLENPGDKTTTLGYSAYINFDEDFFNSQYIALHYNTITRDDAENIVNFLEDSGSVETQYILEYGKRWQIGTGWGMNLTFAPSVMYITSTISENASILGKRNPTALAWNFLKFDLLF